MTRGLGLVTLVVRDYDEAIAFFVGALGYAVAKDVADRSTLEPEKTKRWVVLAPRGGGANLLLARAAGPEQEARIGDQTGGRVSFFHYTDDFERDYAALKAHGAAFPRGAARDEAYGRIVVFADLYGNLWDLVGPA